MRYFFLCLLLCLAYSLEAQQASVTTITHEFPASGGVKLHSDGNLYVANFGQALGNANGTEVWRLSPQGNLALFANGLAGASGNAFDSQGNLFQSNIGGNSISKITPNGTVSLFSQTGIVNPVGIAIDKNDNLYVCNCGNNTLRKISPAGVSTVFASGGLFNCPNGITIDPGGNLYVANFGNGNVIKITPSGNPSLFVTIPGNNNGHLTYFEPDKVLFVNSHGSSSIYEVGMDRQVTKIAGSGIRGNLDGPALFATFSRPNGIAASATGDTLWVNSSIPTQDNPATNSFPLNPSVVRMITGLRPGSTPVDGPVRQQAFQLRTHPNPASFLMHIQLTLKQAMDLQFRLYNMEGKKVWEQEPQNLSPGDHQLDLPRDTLPAGMYLLAAEGDNFVSHQKVVWK